MVRALLALIRAVLDLVRSAWLVELVGAACVVTAVYLAWGTSAAIGAAGVALLLKSVELDTRGKA